MPIRPELRHFYQTPSWRAARRRALERAGGRFDSKGRYLGGAKCEQCGKPDRRLVWVYASTYGEFWTLHIHPFLQRWTHCVFGSAGKTVLPPRQIAEARKAKTLRRIRGQVGVAHVNHTPGDDRDENLKVWCNWCHLHHDQLKHKETRSARKDRNRPLLQDAG